MAVEVAEVHLWGRLIGAVAWDADREFATFEYDRRFQRSGIEVAPLHMPLGPTFYSFPELSRSTFRGLPGMLADQLPDKFGNALIDVWLAGQGRSPSSFSPIERLCYVGRRGMGALEFLPALRASEANAGPLDIAQLTRLAGQALAQKQDLQLGASPELNAEALAAIIQVGTSAGGARAKAVIGWNEETGEVRSGQLDLPQGFDHWLLKFDGVSENRDKELADPLGFGRVEFAYSSMARAAGIDMAETRLLEEGGRAHFMTRRFDRVDGARLHLQSLTAIAHYDFNMAGAHSYEQAFQVLRRLNLGAPAIEALYRRAVFNIVCRNQDDHTKNIAFLMDRSGTWSLAPAFDLTFAWNPDGAWTSRHQMSAAGKRDHFLRRDLVSLGRSADLSTRDISRVLSDVAGAAARWHEFATAAEVDEAFASHIGSSFRADLVDPSSDS